LRTTYNGAVEGSYTSLPFGDGTTTTGTDNDPYHFAELDYDYPSATDHAQFRQYTPTQGRWFSPDPYSGSYDGSNPQSMNRYAYVGNNPLSFLDPSGLCEDVAVTMTNLDGSPIGDGTETKKSGGIYGTACCPQGTGFSEVNGWTVCGPPSAIGILQGQVQAKMGCTQGNCNGSTSGGNAPSKTSPLNQWPLNGNMLPLTPQPQDQKCSVPLVGPTMDSNPAVKSCCQAHDDCYAAHGCNLTSWEPFLFPLMNLTIPGSCTLCNAKAAACIGAAARTIF
jgi:RHS repeat-associated protein